MKPKPKITHAELRKLVKYQKATGLFVRDYRSIGSWDGAGYWSIRIEGKSYRAHKLAWFYVTGEWTNGVKHRDGNRMNNRWSNLVEVGLTRKRNMKSNNKSGILGVYQRPNGKFTSSIWVQGKSIYLGSHPTPEAAGAAYVEAERVYCGAQ